MVESNKCRILCGQGDKSASASAGQPARACVGYWPNGARRCRTRVLTPRVRGLGRWATGPAGWGATKSRKEGSKHEGLKARQEEEEADYRLSIGALVDELEPDPVFDPPHHRRRHPARGCVHEIIRRRLQSRTWNGGCEWTLVRGEGGGGGHW